VAVSRKRRSGSHTLAKQGQSTGPRTILAAIEEAFVETLKSLSALVERTAKPGISEGDALKAMPEMTSLAQRAAKLATFAYPGARALSSQSAVKLAALWRETNAPEAEVERILRMAGRRSRGRPATLRGAGLQALELQCNDPERWTWRALTNNLCNCGLREHPYNSKCQKNLRREALLVKKFLRELGVKLPTQRNNR